MSAAASRLELQTPHLGAATTEQAEDKQEHEALQKLAGIAPPGPSPPVIAVDLDDVLGETNQAVADWHNATYGTNMDTSHFYYYYYWKNPFWGTIKETFDKVSAFYKTDTIYQIVPIPGAQEGVQTLKDMGFRLIIVTAREEERADESWEWVEKYFPGIFDGMICIAQFKHTHKPGHEIVTKLNKAQVCEEIGAKVLIDDSAENAIQCVTTSKPTPVLLFGNYEWNRRLSEPGDARESMCFDIRLKASGGKEFWKEETLSVPEGAPLWRVQDWSEVIRWVRRARAEGQL